MALRPINRAYYGSLNDEQQDEVDEYLVCLDRYLADDGNSLAGKRYALRMSEEACALLGVDLAKLNEV